MHKHCRAIISGRKASNPCTRNNKSGTWIKGHWSPKKDAAQHSAASRIQAILRGRRSRSSNPRARGAGSLKRVYSAGKIAAAIKKHSARRSAEKKKADKLAKLARSLA